MAWTGVLHALLAFLPAFVANMSPVFMAKLLPRWNARIDGGRTDRKGRPLLGPGKTWRGLVGGTITGGLTALAVAWLAPPAAADGLFDGWDYGFDGHAGEAVGAWCGEPDGPPRTDAAGAAACAADESKLWGVFLFGALVGGFALVGDAVKSYFKRRRGKERGAAWFPFDQLDFVVFGLLGVLLGAPLLADGWATRAFFGGWVVPTTLLVGTPLLHLLVNRIGYWMGLKEVPW